MSDKLKSKNKRKVRRGKSPLPTSVTTEVEKEKMKLSIYGTGYVGLISGVCFARMGHSVMSFDIDKEKIDRLNRGEAIIYEKDLTDLLNHDLTQKSLAFTHSFEEALAFSEIHLICVGTPPQPDGAASLVQLFAVVEKLARKVQEPFTLIVKSTVPVGTANEIIHYINQILEERKVSIPFEVVSCPEFLAQGEAVASFLRPDRIIVGTDSKKGLEIVRELYSPLLEKNSIEMIRMSHNAAELTKYASNLFLATKISYVNEISRIAELTEADINEVIRGMTSDKRIGPAMSNPGCGFGGSCFPKDIRALIYQAKQKDFDPQLLQAVQNVNLEQKDYFINRILDYLGHNTCGKVVAVWGLSFKPNTDDIRESVGVDLIEKLLEKGVFVQAYDPVAASSVRQKYPNDSSLVLVDSKEAALKNADLLAVMTNWQEFYAINSGLIKKEMKTPAIFDGRNIYDCHQLLNEGIAYFAAGVGFHPASVFAG